jgi:predicted NBD/HSP70 family sugar kinase
VNGRIGIDLGGTKISGVVLDGDGVEVTRARLATPRNDYRATLGAIARLVADLEMAADLSPGKEAVGVGTPGSWQPRLGTMKNCNSTWLNGRRLLPDLEALLGPRVRLANDADCLALSEALDGAGARAESVFGVILGTGVGGALVVAGRLLHGPNGLSGEWGHVPLPYFRQYVFAGDNAAEEGRFQLESQLRDRPCYCGRLNCIEAFLSGPGLEATHTELWRGTSSAEDIVAGTDEQRSATWRVYEHMLARSLAQVVNLFDPGVMVIGGGVSNAPRLYPALESLIPAFAFTSLRETDGAPVDDVRVAVRPARWGDDSGVRGAARLWDSPQTVSLE